MIETNCDNVPDIGVVLDDSRDGRWCFDELFLEFA